MLNANEIFTINEVCGIEDSDELIKKYGKLLKTRKSSKSQKLFKSRKLAKSRKKLSKSGNLSNFDTKENRSSFLTSDAKTAFNYLWLAFTKALIL